MSKLQPIWGFVFICFIISALMNGCNDKGYNKEAEDAYKRLRDQGYTTKQIYEMGKKK